jgi:methionyl aminopeptidase
MSGFGFKSKKDTFKYTGSQRPGVLSPKRTVPDSIIKPDYWADSKPKTKAPVLPWSIPVNSPEEIAGIRAGRF